MDEMDRLKRKVSELEEQNRKYSDELAQYEIIFNESIDMVCIADMHKSSFIKVSPAFTRILGYERDEMEGKEFAEFIHEDDLAKTAEVVKNKLQLGERTINFVNRYRCKDGSYRVLDWTSQPNIETGVLIAIARDISESINYKERILETEERYKRLTENAEDIIWRADGEGTVLFVNSVAEKLLGYTFDESVGIKVSKYMTNESIEKINSIVKKNLSKTPPKLSYQVEAHYVHKDGTRIPFEINANVILDKDNKIVGYEGISRDIRERKQNEERLKENELKFASLFNSMVEGVALHKVIYDEDGNAINYVITDVNPAYEKILGVDKQDIVGKTATEAYHTDTAPFFDEYIKVAETGVPYSFEVNFEPLEKFFSIQVFSPAKDEFATVFEDITTRKKSEKDQQRLVALVENSSEFIGLANLDGSVIHVNKAGIRMVGLNNLEEAKQTSIFEYVTEEVREDLAANILPAVFEQGFANGESSMKNFKTDEELFIRYTVFIIRNPETEEPESIAFVANDITESIQAKIEKDKLEVQLQQAQKMEAIGRLAGGIAHDFNNLLTGITGNISLAIMDMDKDDPLLETLEEVEAASHRAAELTRQLLAFSRKQLIKPKIINLNELIENMQKMLKRIIGEDIGQKIVLDKDLGQVKADPGQIEQIVINLAVNARDALPDGGFLTIETKHAMLDENYCVNHPQVLPGEYILLVVSDNGHGMDEETRQKIFDPFFTTKPKDKGTGLGLATTYGIIKQHDGHIECYSEVGQGTSFKVYLPRIDGLAESVRFENRNIDLPEGNETILVVEDETVVRNIAIKILEKLGYTIIHAESGSHALDIINEEKPDIDLLLTDVVMPKMNGRELATQLQDLYPLLKVIYTSGYTENVIAHHGVIEEGLEFIGKPYSPKDLAIKIRNVLDNS